MRTTGSSRKTSAAHLSSRNGFTLVELLVVVAIIATLIAILLPSLKKARESARAVLCQNNHRQLLLGLQMYTEDTGGFMPVPKANVHSNFVWDGKTYTGSNDEVWVPWFGAPFVGKYINNTLVTNGSSNSVIYCPSLNVSKMMAMNWWDGNKNSNGIGLNYMWNCAMYDNKQANGTTGGFVRFMAIRSPARMVILSDAAGRGYVNGSSSWDTLTREVDGAPYDANGVPKINDWVSSNAYRHNKTCTLTFADGHTASTADAINDNKNYVITTKATN